MSTPQTLGFTMKLINFTGLLNQLSKIVNPLVCIAFFCVLVILLLAISVLAWIGFFIDCGRIKVIHAVRHSVKHASKQVSKIIKKVKEKVK